MSKEFQHRSPLSLCTHANAWRLGAQVLIALSACVLVLTSGSAFAQPVPSATGSATSSTLAAQIETSGHAPGSGGSRVDSSTVARLSQSGDANPKIAETPTKVELKVPGGFSVVLEGYSLGA